MVNQITSTMLVLFFVFCSCSKNENISHENSDLNVNNIELLNEINSFTMQLAKINKQKIDFAIRLYCFTINDTTTQFVITAEERSQFNNLYPYHFVVKTKCAVIYVTDMTLIVPSENNSKNFFTNKRRSRKDSIEAIEIQKHPNKPIERFIVSYTGVNYYLRFERGKIKYKAIKGGDIYDYAKK